MPPPLWNFCTCTCPFIVCVSTLRIMWRGLVSEAKPHLNKRKRKTVYATKIIRLLVFWSIYQLVSPSFIVPYFNITIDSGIVTRLLEHIKNIITIIIVIVIEGHGGKRASVTTSTLNLKCFNLAQFWHTCWFLHSLHWFFFT